MMMGFFTLFGNSSCSVTADVDNDEEVVDLRINHFKQTAFGVAPRLVFLVQESEEIGGEEWSYFYDGIEGIEYEIGYIYDISVKKERVENPPQDASSNRYILQKIISKEKVDSNENFEIRLKWEETNFVNERDGAHFLMNQYKIDCAEMCPDLSHSLENEEELTGTFSHGSNGELKLISIQ